MLGAPLNASEGRVFQGPCGTATEVLISGDLPRPDVAATLSTWFLNCPGQSPAWDNYLLSIIHLRPIEGVRPAVISVPKATHEVLLLAADPTTNPTAMDPDSWQFLFPHNVSEQIELPDDVTAVMLLEDCARAVVDGILPAEPALAGAVEPWRTVLIKTAAHARGEEHAP